MRSSGHLSVQRDPAARIDNWGQPAQVRGRGTCETNIAALRPHADNPDRVTSWWIGAQRAFWREIRAGNILSIKIQAIQLRTAFPETRSLALRRTAQHFALARSERRARYLIMQISL
jgi:hypothetical protein